MENATYTNQKEEDENLVRKFVWNKAKLRNKNKYENVKVRKAIEKTLT